MPVEFNSFPANWRIPLFYVEVDPSQAGLPVTREPALMVGQMLTADHGASLAGTATTEVAVPIGTLSEAQKLFGRGSMLSAMFARWFNNSFAQEVWALPVAEPSSGAIATGQVTVNITTPDFGTIYLYVARQLVQIGVAQGDSATVIASSIVAAVNADADLPVTAHLTTTGGPDVTFTSKWKGLTGNDIYLDVNVFGHIGGEDYPPGVTLTLPNSNRLTGGTGFPTWTNSLANIGDSDFKYVAMPFTDEESLIAWEYEYGFTDGGRWGWLRALYGVIFSAVRYSYADMLGWGATQNSGIFTAMGVEPDSPSPVWEWAAAYCSKAARALLNDPARPLQTLELEGIVSAPLHKRFTKTELNVFTTAGIATQEHGANGKPMILRESTTYQLNSFGMTDDAYELITTMATLTRLFRNMKQLITSKFPRHKLADDGTRFGVGQAIVTPKIVKAVIVGQYAVDEFNGLVENVTAFKQNLVVERDPNDPNRLNVLYPPDLVNQLRVFATLAQFRLQYNRGVDTAIGNLI